MGQTHPSPEMKEILSFVATGNALPLLHEIKHALVALLESGEETTIDLGAIPFAPGDERILNDALGVGEVQATLSVMGESHVRETAIPGVWRIDHLDDSGEMQSRFIEITFMPNILKTQREDAERGIETLNEKLKSFDDNQTDQRGS
ncbi:MAG: hydrogenase expression/formation protein [Rhodospirillaceae bacterium]|nr:hydrogenase expression/formation protein [Rhodospirillaceae bacterium]